MPAVNPVRLRFQSEGLMAFFHSPSEFHSRLNSLFDLYANHALRFGEESGVKPVLPMYHLPQPVLRQLKSDLNSHIQKFPEAALSLADELWDDNYYEVKQLATHILGDIPIDTPDAIINRLNEWVKPGLDSKLVSDLFSIGIMKLQEHYPEFWEGYIKSLLVQESPEKLALGIKGLREGLKNPKFNNLPTIFRLLSPILQSPSPSIVKELEKLIRALIEESPTETSFYIKQLLAINESQKTKRLIKQCLPAFPPAHRDEIKSMLDQ